MIKPFFPPNRQGIAADAIVILCNLILFPLLAGRVEGLFTAFFSNDQSSLAVLAPIMMLILAGRLIGLYLKRFGLQSRLAEAEDGGFPILFFVFSFPLLILTASFMAVGFSAWAAEGGSSAGSGAIQYAGVFVLIALAYIEAYLLYRLGVPLNEHEREMRGRGVWMYTWLGELAADFGLFAYMIIWQIFYHQVAEMLTTRPDGAPMPLDMKLVSLFFMAVCFMLFYLAPRAVFLIEDRKYRGTWLMIGLVFLSSLTGLF